MRCLTCSEIKFADIRFGGLVQQQPSFIALKKSAESGCDLCHLSYTALTAGAPKTDILEWENLVHETAVHFRGLVYDHHPWRQISYKMETVGLTLSKDGIGKDAADRLLKLYAIEGTPPAKYIVGRMPSPTPLDPLCWSSIKRWLDICDKKHDKCAGSEFKSPLPTRVLNIEGKKPVVLVSAKTKESNGDYVALSYCWGTKGKNVRLTKERYPQDSEATYDEFTSTGVELNRLAKTVRDAITVCKSLGIKYLWVDALCIIQDGDNSVDFKFEAPRMCEYYSNSYFTLVVGSAQDCADGFLNDRAKPRAPPCELKYDRLSLNASPERHITGTVSLSLPSWDDGYLAINSRAWTYQERLLSQRTLLYTNSQVSFKCRTSYVKEDGDFGQVSSLNQNWDAMNGAPPTIHHIGEHDSEEEAQKYAYNYWLRSIGPYTWRNMSRASDKLAAIAGTAKYVQEVVHCKYMYGLWQGDMLRGLSWQSIVPGAGPAKGRMVKRVKDQAPSWSWASIDGAVASHLNPPKQTAFEDSENSRLEIISHHNVSSALDPIMHTRDIPKAFELHVRGLITRVSLSMPDKKRVYYGWKSSFTILSQGSFKGDGQDPREDYTATGYWDSTEDVEMNRYLNLQVHALQLITTWGLLLERVDGDRYQRIGSFSHAKKELFEGEDVMDIILI